CAHPASTEIYPLSLHDALPISARGHRLGVTGHLVEQAAAAGGGVVDLVDVGTELAAPGGHTVHGLPGAHPLIGAGGLHQQLLDLDRKSTRLNSSHVKISYAVFC